MIFIDNKYTKWYYSIVSNAVSRISVAGYCETHHIIPKSIGGNNLSENLVKLTAKEHFICHLLLTKMTTGKNKDKMCYAFWCLCNRMKNNILSINARTYQVIKEEFSVINSKTHKGKILSQETKDKISRAHTGKKLSEEHKVKINPKGRTHTENAKLNISNGQKGRLGGMQDKHHTAETKKKISDGNKGKIMQPLSNERKTQISLQFLGTTQTDDHVIKRIESRKQSGYYKDRDLTIEKMKLSAQTRSKLKCRCGKECSPSNFKRWHGDNCKLIKS